MMIHNGPYTRPNGSVPHRRLEKHGPSTNAKPRSPWAFLAMASDDSYDCHGEICASKVLVIGLWLGNLLLRNALDKFEVCYPLLFLPLTMKLHDTCGLPAKKTSAIDQIKRYNIYIYNIYIHACSFRILQASLVSMLRDLFLCYCNLMAARALNLNARRAKLRATQAHMMLVQMLSSTILKPPAKFLKFWPPNFGAVSDF